MLKSSCQDFRLWFQSIQQRSITRTRIDFWSYHDPPFGINCNYFNIEDHGNHKPIIVDKSWQSAQIRSRFPTLTGSLFAFRKGKTGVDFKGLLPLVKYPCSLEPLMPLWRVWRFIPYSLDFMAFAAASWLFRPVTLNSWHLYKRKMIRVIIHSHSLKRGCCRWKHFDWSFPFYNGQSGAYLNTWEHSVWQYVVFVLR